MQKHTQEVVAYTNWISSIGDGITSEIKHDVVMLTFYLIGSPSLVVSY